MIFLSDLQRKVWKGFDVIVEEPEIQPLKMLQNAPWISMGLKRVLNTQILPIKKKKTSMALTPKVYVPDINSQNLSCLKLRIHLRIYMLWILRVDIFNFPAGQCRKKWSPCRCWVHVLPSYGWSHCARGKNMKEADLKTAILTLTTFSFLSKLSDWWQKFLIGLLVIWGEKMLFFIPFSSCHSCCRDAFLSQA